MGLKGEISLDTSIPGHEKISEGSNVLLQPQPDTLVPIPWAGQTRDPEIQKNRIGLVLCESVWPGTMLPQAECPRYLARQQIERLGNLEYKIRAGVELEFMLYNTSTNKLVEEEPGNFLRSDTWDQLEDVFIEINQALCQMGIYAEASHVEYLPSQFEISLRPELGIKSADDAFVAKDAIRQIFHRRRQPIQPIFMAYCCKNPFGNAFHFNVSLEDEHGKKTFYDELDDQRLSSLSRNFLAGLIAHAPVMTAVLCPTLNCYRRLNQSSVANKADWGIGNRHTAYRCINTDPKSTRIEARVPSGSANPYLVTAAIIAAGIDGIERKLECPAAVDPGAHELPATLEKAVALLEMDTCFTKSLGSEFVKWFLQSKKKEMSVFDDIQDDEAALEAEVAYYKRI